MLGFLCAHWHPKRPTIGHVHSNKSTAYASERESVFITGTHKIIQRNVYCRLQPLLYVCCTPFSIHRHYSNSFISAQFFFDCTKHNNVHMFSAAFFIAAVPLIQQIYFNDAQFQTVFAIFEIRPCFFLWLNRKIRTVFVGAISKLMRTDEKTVNIQTELKIIFHRKSNGINFHRKWPCLPF